MSKDNWTQFFKEAGVPLSVAKRYSTTFDDNRISKDMLMDLNKEILTSMGVVAMGDIINILKHAKKIHSLDVKRKDTPSTVSKTVVSANKRPTPTAHSTTTGQAPAVSTTSAAAAAASTKKKIVARYSKSDIPDSLSPELPVDLPTLQEPEVAYVGYIIDSGKKEVVLEPQSNVRSGQLLPVEEGTEYYVASTMEEDPADLVEGRDFQNSYETSQYGAKRSRTMYSDELVDYGQTKQPRVIVIPGERQDMFTTSGLQKAAKVYETGEEQEGKLTTDRSRRLLESAGLIPPNEKVSGNSVFSRLDYKPSVTSSSHLSTSSPSTVSHPILAPVTQGSSPSTRAAVVERKRIINLTSKHSSSSSKPVTRTITTSTTPTSRSVPSPAHKKRSIVTTTTRESSGSSSVRTSSSSVPSRTLVKRLVSRGEESRTPATQRLGIRKRTSSNPERVAVKMAKTVVTRSPGKSTVRFARTSGGSGDGRSGLFGYEGARERKDLVPVIVEEHPTPSSSSEVKVRSSMVADEYEYQTQRQRDIRTRLEVKEFEKKSRRGGPLVGRLASHQIFRRLE